LILPHRRYRFGLVTTCHDVPFQRSIRVSVEVPDI
jgi:hypothetical protein